MWDLKGINHDAYAHGKCLLFSFVDMWCICPRIVLNVNINWSVQIKNSFLRSQYFCPWLPKLIDVWNKELSFYIYGRVIEQAWGQDGCIFAKSSFFVCLSETTQDDVKETEKKQKTFRVHRGCNQFNLSGQRPQDRGCSRTRSVCPSFTSLRRGHWKGRGREWEEGVGGGGDYRSAKRRKRMEARHGMLQNSPQRISAFRWFGNLRTQTCFRLSLVSVVGNKS